MLLFRESNPQGDGPPMYHKSVIYSIGVKKLERNGLFGRRVVKRSLKTGLEEPEVKAFAR
jgi:hypothetical protein